MSVIRPWISDGLARIRWWKPSLGMCIAAQRLRARRAHLVVYPEPAVIHAHFEPDEGSLGSAWADGVLGLLEEIGGQGPAEVVIEAMPADARPGRDVFAGASGLDLMRAIKRRFDPEGILNPGRFAGWI